MSERDETLAFLGLSSGASLAEIERAFVWRRAAARDRLAAGDESARVELAALEQAYERFFYPGASRGGASQPQSGATGEDGIEYAPAAQSRLRTPAWWESYLSLIVALASVAVLARLVADLPHVYSKGGFLAPLALVVISAVLSIAAAMLAEAELRVGRRDRFLERKGLDAQHEFVRLRLHAARIANLLSRAVRWLVVAAFIATVLLNFASLSGRWSLRH
ncbi:MAG: hypothetical protein ABSC51_03585 [Gaiellaceae bacterium]|jgi:hypothetical protein